jgi:hypothetical protein
MEASNYLKMKKTGWLILIALLCSVFSQAQSHLWVHAGTGFPVGDFFDQGHEYVNIGPAAGIKYTYTFKETGLSLFCSADFLYNTIKKDYRESIIQLIESGGPFTNVEMEFSEYINVPVIAGLQYSVGLFKPVATFGEAGLGVSLLKLTDSKYQSDQTNGNVSYSIDPAFSYKAGLGFLIIERISVAVHYYGLGKHTINYKIETSDGIQESVESEKKGSELALRLGYRF